MKGHIYHKAGKGFLNLHFSVFNLIFLLLRAE